jgi:hypothetical protein
VNLKKNIRIEKLNINVLEWKTNFGKRSVEFDEFKSSFQWPKDMHPAIHFPEFCSPQDAGEWLASQEPVISLVIKGKARAYPLGVLLSHEIANDEVLGVPVAVTYCPLCNSAIVFDRRIGEDSYSFGVAGVLRRSNLVMYDRSTETWWQQVTGEGLVGDLAGIRLKRLPSQIISFAQFAAAYPKGRVLMPYFWGTNRYYVGYDDTTPAKRPKYCPETFDNRLHPAERVVTVEMGGKSKAYPFSLTKKLGAINDEVEGLPVVIFHSSGAVSPVDKVIIAESREVGSTGVFDRKVDGKILTFAYQHGKFMDKETSSVWDITGRAVEGKLTGQQLIPLLHGDEFWFVWSGFHPDTEIFASY